MSETPDSYPPPPPPPPPPARHRRGLIITGVSALLVGALTATLISSIHFGTSGSPTATSASALTASEIARRVDPGLVDIVSANSLAQTRSAGTGIVLTANGEILTNNHVIEGATSIKVTDVGNGHTYSASVVGYDASDDVAVIQLQGASGLTTASLGDSGSVGVGDQVVALGNAQGRGGTPAMATGTVTALGQSITASDSLASSSEQLTGLIESDTPIQPGDSGGALVNTHGAVVGMNTAASSSYQFQQTTATSAYSIPISKALTIAHQIEAGQGSSTVHTGATAFIGVGFAQQDQGGFGGAGATIGYIQPGSPASQIGLAQGDTVTALGGQQVSSGTDVKHILVTYHPGDKIAVSWTDTTGQQHNATLILGTGPAA